MTAAVPVISADTTTPVGSTGSSGSGSSAPISIPVPPPSASETVAATPSTVPLVVSGVAMAEIATSSAQILVTTNEAASVQADYGPTTSYGSTTSITSVGTLLRTVAVTDLLPSTLYHYRVITTNQSGDSITSGDEMFRTQNLVPQTPITGTTLPPFQLGVAGGSQVVLPNSAFQCQTPALPNEPPEPPKDGPDAPAVFFGTQME